MASDQMDVQCTVHEVIARKCKFDTNELKWLPSGSAPEQIELQRASGGTLKLALGSDSVPLSDVVTVSLLAPSFVTLQITNLGHLGLQFDDEAQAKSFSDELRKRKGDYERFEQYDPSSVQSYFQYYAKLGNQQNMLQDQVRTSTYRRSIIENPDDFRGQTVMDIGAGSGILSFFAAQAGASAVYAVEASSMAEVTKLLAEANSGNFQGQIEVVNKTLEAIRDEVPEKVDVLVSEPIGTFLFNERMIETYLCARDRFLKPGGKMFPNCANLCIAPFSDTTLHWEQQNKNGFWKNTSFYGLDLTAALKRCTKEHFCQPIVDYVNPEYLMAKAHTTKFDFMTVSIESLQKIEIPFDFEISSPCLIHGLAGWFDAFFEGANQTITLSTAPWCPGTHWYQIRFLLEVPLAVNAGQHVEGVLKMEANNLQSYYVSLLMRIQGTNIISEAPRIDLKDPEYRFYTSPNAYCPPGTAGVWGQQQGQQSASPSPAPAAQPAAQYGQPAAQYGQAAGYAAPASPNTAQQGMPNGGQPGGPFQACQQNFGQYAAVQAAPDFVQVNGYSGQCNLAQQPWQGCAPGSPNGTSNGLMNGDVNMGSSVYPPQNGATRHRKKFRSPQNSARM
mmetsp:Transcript_47837/g.84831  ORF Transcript_47837/g.84831 Transcript_47837/m.84831 type:complete len:616 (-) Transcript_47837:86-1933(-)